MHWNVALDAHAGLMSEWNDWHVSFLLQWPTIRPVRYVFKMVCRIQVGYGPWHGGLTKQWRGRTCHRTRSTKQTRIHLMGANSMFTTINNPDLHITSCRSTTSQQTRSASCFNSITASFFSIFSISFSINTFSCSFIFTGEAECSKKVFLSLVFSNPWRNPV